MPTYRFGDFAVDTDAVEVVGPDGPREFEPQVYNVLQYLIEQRGRLVPKEELLDNVWGDRFVSESAMTTRIKQARRLLDDDGRSQWAIKTVHGRGYRFVPDVEIEERVRTTTSLDHPSTGALPPQLPAELKADARQLFCGREDELAQCLQIVDRPSAGQAADRDRFGWVWLLGEPGIGKTRLAAELARASQERGHRVFFGRNNEDLRVPYQPFIEVVRSAIGDADADAGPDVLATLPLEFAPLFPELGLDVDNGSIHPSGSGDASLRYELFEAMAEWLSDRARDRPVTMIIDDVHWAADSTLQLISHLQRRHRGAALTIVMTSRDTAPDVNPKVADLIAAGQGTPNSTVVRLEGLSGDAARKLVGRDVALDDVMRQTAGNPLLLQAVNPDDGSVDIGSAVHRRLASLPQGVRDTLALASVIGLEFELSVVADAARRDDLDVLDDLEQALAARILDDVGVDRFRFTHAVIRSSLRDELTSARQARLHGRIAGAIAERFPDDPRRLPTLAFHTAEAAAADPALRPLAVDRLGRAAEESMAQLSFEEAAAQLQRARQIVGPDDPHLAAQLGLRQGAAETRAGQNHAAVATFEDVIAAASTTTDALLRIEAALRYEDAAWRPGVRNDRVLAHLDDAGEVFEEAVTQTGGVDDELRLRVRLAIARLRALALSGQGEQVVAEFPAAHTLTRELGDASLEALLVGVYLSHVRFFGNLDGVDPLIDRLAELEPEIDDGDVALSALHTRILHATMMGRFELLPDLAERMIRQQERSHSVFWEFIRTNQAAMEMFSAADLDGSERLAERCRELAEELVDEDGSGAYGLRMFLIRREQDRLASMAPLVRHVLSRTDMGGIWTPGLALLLIETGDPDGAADAIAEVRAGGFEVPVDAMWSTVMVLLIEACVRIGDVEACRMLHDRFARLRGLNVLTGSGLVCFGRAERYLGMLAATMGDLEAAEEYLGVALEADAASGSPLWSNESRLWLSRVRRAQGHTAEADAMLEVVRREAADAGLARLERLATAELANP